VLVHLSSNTSFAQCVSPSSPIGFFFAVVLIASLLRWDSGLLASLTMIRPLAHTIQHARDSTYTHAFQDTEAKTQDPTQSACTAISTRFQDVACECGGDWRPRRVCSAPPCAAESGKSCRSASITSRLYINPPKTYSTYRDWRNWWTGLTEGRLSVRRNGAQFMANPKSQASCAGSVLAACWCVVCWLCAVPQTAGDSTAQSVRPPQPGFRPKKESASLIPVLQLRLRALSRALSAV
jgi:hypothetical protein